MARVELRGESIELDKDRDGVVLDLEENVDCELLFCRFMLSLQRQRVKNGN
jgi:hypothetical protein